MRSFLCKLFFFTLIFSSTSFFTIKFYLKLYSIELKHVAAPNLSVNYGLNDKLKFIYGKNAEIISIGSSITLNNINSKLIIDKFENLSYLNLGSWGAKIECTYKLLKIQTKKYKPKIVIMASNFSDFENDKNKIDFNNIDNYLLTKYEYLYYFKNFSLKYYINRSKENVFIKENKNIYNSLAYDFYGGVSISCNNFTIDSNRWKNSYIYKTDQINYFYFDKILKFCKSHKIKFIFLQSPTRFDLLKNRNDEEKLKSHIKKIKSRIFNFNFTFINSNKLYLSKDNFIDGIHLNEKGGYLFTNYCMNIINIQ